MGAVQCIYDRIESCKQELADPADPDLLKGNKKDMDPDPFSQNSVKSFKLMSKYYKLRPKKLTYIDDPFLNALYRTHIIDYSKNNSYG